ncbi:MAG: hypothetical protein AVDCRST_MAG75-2023 [uncultured Propionibacteriaceae bacterium]|uniref:DUF998 domain-containing protein n=1 Tax=uncultured Propionibacteriaceae bacterium TaxID=257457 RepID=A0A6J4NWN3_9ACTN|nr:MAG: hypothetical protein AVDCRST_MAG75-2023 [uncultured Propionibacteriaceae bacterium]
MTVLDHQTVTGAPLAPSLLLGLGGLTWVPARYGVMTTWEGTWLGLEYGGWNRLMLVPLLLLTAGAVAAARAASRRRTRVAWAVLATGFALAGTGVAIEFIVGGGLQGGPESIAVAGWTVYLLGQFVTAVAALVLAAALAREGPRGAAAAAVVAGIATLAWPAAAIRLSVELADQVLIGLAWVALGVLVRRALSRRRPTSPG